MQPRQPGALKIQAAARAVGVSPQTIRKWERHGLIHCRRDNAGRRYFLPPDLARLQLIKDLLGRGTRMEAAARVIRDLEAPPPERRTELGRTLTTLRESRGWTRTQVAQSTAIGETRLAALEAGRSNGTLATLQALATLYGIALIDLVRGGAGVDPALVRADARPVLMTSGDGIVLEGLAQGDVHLRPLLVTAEAGAGVDAFHGHPGEEFIWVASGQLQVELSDGRSYLLEPGDSLAFRSEVLHRWCAGTSIMRAIWVHRDAEPAWPAPAPPASPSRDDLRTL